MPGFSGVLGRVNDVLRSVDLAIPLSNTTENKQYSFENIWLKRFVVPKFLGDKIFDEDDEFLLCTDGVFLNATTLRARYSVTTNLMICAGHLPGVFMIRRLTASIFLQITLEPNPFFISSIETPSV